jgi:hypothetical protein
VTLRRIDRRYAVWKDQSRGDYISLPGAFCGNVPEIPAASRLPVPNPGQLGVDDDEQSASERSRYAYATSICKLRGVRETWWCPASITFPGQRDDYSSTRREF